MWPSNLSRSEARGGRHTGTGRSSARPNAVRNGAWASTLCLGQWLGQAAALLLSTMAVAAVTPMELVDRPLLLEVRVNSVEQPDGVEALPIRGGLALPLEAWQALHLRPPKTPPVQHGGRHYYALDGATLSWRLDTPTQTLWIEAPAAAFAGGPIVSASGPAALRPEADLGAFGNYDMLWQRSTRGGTTSASALTELGVFGGVGFFRMTNLLQFGSTQRTATRLDTTWVMDDAARMASLRVGDTTGVPGTWGRATRFGGIQWTTDFSLQPAFQAFPLPSLRGETSLPSTVELFVDNSRRLQGQVQPGAFDLNELPVVTGQGEIRMVVRDLLGREQVVVAPYYASAALLRPGLHATSFELGAIREGYGVTSQRYGSLFASATDRLGINDRYTREWRAEASSRQLSVGYGGTWLFPAFGTLQVSGVASRRGQGSGGMLIAAAERQARDWSGSLQLKTASRDFAQVGTARRESMRTTVALALGRAWHGIGIGASFLQQTAWGGPRRQIVGMNLSHSVGGIGTLGLFALRDAVSGQTSLSLSFSCSLDGRSSMSTVVNRQQGEDRSRQSETLLWQRPIQDNDGLGVQLAAERGEFSRNTAQVQWQTRTALLSAGVAQGRHGSEVRAGASGGFAWLGDSVFASRRIEGSFAVVEVGDYPNVTVLHDHHPVAVTDRHGRALVSTLRGYEVNRIDIDPSGLPFDAEVESFETLVIPPARSGVAVKIPLRRVSAASFRVVDADGAVIPVGSELQVVGQERSFPIGFDGRAYASGLSGQDRAVIRWSAHECAVQLSLPATDIDMPELGTLRCL